MTCAYSEWEQFDGDGPQPEWTISNRLDTDRHAVRGFGDCAVTLSVPSVEPDEADEQCVVMPIEFGGRLVLTEYRPAKQSLTCFSVSSLHVLESSVPAFVAPPLPLGSRATALAVGVLIGSEAGVEVRYLSKSANGGWVEPWRFGRAQAGGTTLAFDYASPQAVVEGEPIALAVLVADTGVAAEGEAATERSAPRPRARVLFLGTGGDVLSQIELKAARPATDPSTPMFDSNPLLFLDNGGRGIVVVHTSSGQLDRLEAFDAATGSPRWSGTSKSFGSPAGGQLLRVGRIDDDEVEDFCWSLPYLGDAESVRYGTPQGGLVCLSGATGAVIAHFRGADDLQFFGDSLATSASKPGHIWATTLGGHGFVGGVYLLDLKARECVLAMGLSKCPKLYSVENGFLCSLMGPGGGEQLGVSSVKWGVADGVGVQFVDIERKSCAGGLLIDEL